MTDEKQDDKKYPITEERLIDGSKVDGLIDPSMLPISDEEE